MWSFAKKLFKTCRPTVIILKIMISISGTIEIEWLRSWFQGVKGPTKFVKSRMCHAKSMAWMLTPRWCLHSYSPTTTGQCLVSNSIPTKANPRPIHLWRGRGGSVDCMRGVQTHSAGQWTSSTFRPYTQNLARRNDVPQPNQKWLPTTRIEPRNRDHQSQRLSIKLFLTPSLATLGRHNFEFRSLSRFHGCGSEAGLISISHFTNMPQFFIMRLHSIRIPHFMCVLEVDLRQATFIAS